MDDKKFDLIHPNSVFKKGVGGNW